MLYWINRIGWLNLRRAAFGACLGFLLLTPTLAVALSDGVTPVSGGSPSFFNVAPGYSWIVDESGQKNLQQMYSSNADWQREASPVVNQGYQPHPLWLRYDLATHNLSPLQLYLEIESPFVDELDVYLVETSSGKQISHQMGGDHREKNLRFLNHRYPLFPLDIQSKGSYQIYIRANSESAFMFPINVRHPEQFIRAEMQRQIFYGLFFGMMLVLALYNVIVWAFIHESAYLNNAAFIMMASIYQASLSGLGNQYLWNGNAALNDKMLMVSTLVTIFFGARFVIRFLDLKAISIKLERIASAIGALYLITVIPTLIFPEHYIMPVVSLMELSVCLFALTALSVLCFKGNYWARYLLVGWSILIFGTVVFVLSNMGVIERSILVEFIHGASMALGNVLVTSALAARIRNERSAKNEALDNALALAREVTDLTQEKERLAIHSNIELERRVEQKTEELNEMLQQLKTSNKQLIHATQTDALTGVGNRRYLDARFPELIKQCHQHRSALGVLVIDADHFKQINDVHGHVVGDDCLKKLGTILRRFSRRDLDVLVRYGGEEFVLLLPATDEEGVRNVAESIRSYVEKSSFWFEDNKVPVTVSIGVHVDFPALDTEGEDLVQKADQALYAAKRNGRNRVELFKDCFAAANA